MITFISRSVRQENESVDVEKQLEEMPKQLEEDERALEALQAPEAKEVRIADPTPATSKDDEDGSPS